MTTTLADGTTRQAHSNVVVPPLAGFSLGTNGCKILSGAGDPNAAGTDNSVGHLGQCSVGSLFLRTDAPTASTCLYVKTSLTAWSAVSVP